jgi:hypothetical protein
MKIFLSIIVVMTAFSLAVFAQTNVSGGIYSSVTWTLAGSPYIVTDTIVIFPGVTLTVEPGVVIKFDSSKYIEIRQGSFIAAGTASDSITFTSNSASPVMGSYRGIVFTNPVAINIDYCIFKYANYAVSLQTNFADTLIIQHSYFYKNNNCISVNSSPAIIRQVLFYENNNCISSFSASLFLNHDDFDDNNNCVGTMWGNLEKVFMDSCNFMNNQFGVDVFDRGFTSNCLFSNNGTAMAIDDDTNFKLSNSVFCNNGNAVTMRAHQSHDTIVDCSFSQNHIAISSYVPVDYVAGNILSDNDTALSYVIGAGDSVFNNYIFHNQVGLLYHGYASATMFNNYICNNSIYNIMFSSTINGSIPPVCYCETDSAIIRSKIYDGYVNLTLGLLSFTPFIPCDSSAITALPPISCPAVVITSVEKNNAASKPTVEIYPNPASSSFTIKNISSTEKTAVEIINLVGEIVFAKNISGANELVVDASFTAGIYFVRISEGGENVVKKLIVE